MNNPKHEAIAFRAWQICREDDAATALAIAPELGVSYSHLCHVLKGRAWWKHHVKRHRQIQYARQSRRMIDGETPRSGYSYD